MHKCWILSRGDETVKQCSYTRGVNCTVRWTHGDIRTINTYFFIYIYLFVYSFIYPPWSYDKRDFTVIRWALLSRHLALKFSNTLWKINTVVAAADSSWPYKDIASILCNCSIAYSYICVWVLFTVTMCHSHMTSKTCIVLVFRLCYVSLT